MMYPSFNWWTGVVENRHDPLKMGRCKVRIVGYHSPDMRKMPSDSLPWAVPMMPINSAAQTGVGWSPTGPVEGTWVVGFFRDGEDGQEPVMMGTLPGIPRQGGSKQGGPFKDNRWRNVESMYEATGDPDNPIAKNTKTGNPDLDGAIPKRPASLLYIEEGTPIDSAGTMFQLKNEIVSWDFDPTPYPSGRLINVPTMPRVSLGYDDARAAHGFKQDPNYSTKLKDVSNLEKSQVYLKETTRQSLGSFQTARSTSLAAQNVPLSFQEPKSFYKAKYPYNHARESESGHLVEVDDTPKSERMSWQHRMGTFTEFGPNGYRFNRTHGDQYDTTVGDNYEGTLGIKAVTARGIHMAATTSEIVMKGLGSAEVNIETNTGNMNLFSGGFVKLSSKRGMIIDSDGGDNGIIQFRTKELDVLATGNSRIETSKAFDVQGNTIKMKASSKMEFSSMGNLNLAPKFGFMVKGGYSKEFYTNEFIGTGRLPFTDWTGKEIETMMGNIALKVNTANPKLGAIELMVKTAPIPEGIDLPTNVMGMTYLKLNPLGTQGILMGSPTYISRGTPATPTPLISDDGIINTYTAKAVTIVKSGAVTMLDAPFHFIGGIGIEPAVLGLQFATEYASHMHLTPSGPSSPPTTAAKIMACLSKKIFLAG